MITSAKIEYRHYVPYGWIAFEFCHVHFYGPKSRVLQREWDKIQSERYEQYDAIVREEENKIAEITEEMKAINKELKKKPWYRPWHTKEEKQMNKKYDALLAQREKTKENVEAYEKQRFFNHYEAHRRITELLVSNRFHLVSTSSDGCECKTHTEIWHLGE